MPERPDARRSGHERPHTRVAGGVVATWARFLVVTLIGIVQAPVLFANVSPGDLGVWYLLFAIATLINLSDLGLPSTFARAVAYVRGREASAAEANVASGYLKTSLPELYASALIATSVLAVAFALAAIPAALLYFRYALLGGAAAVTLPLLVFLAGVVLNLVAAIPGACLNGSGDVALDSGIRAAVNVAGFALIVALVPRHPSLTTLCAIYVVQGLLAFAISHGALVWRRGIGRARDMRVNFSLIRRMYRESASIFVSRAGFWLTLESTLLVAGHFLGSARIADFAVLRQIVQIGSNVTTAIPIAVSPDIAAAHARGDQVTARSLYLAAQRYVMILAVLWVIGLLVWAPAVVGALIGREHFLGYAVLVPLAIGSLLELHAAMHGFYMWNVGRWPFAPYVVLGGVLNVAFASIGCASLGFVGLAWGSTASQAATMNWVQVRDALRQVGIGWREYLVDSIRPSLAYAAALGTCAVAIRVSVDHVLTAGAGVGGSARFATGAYALAGIAATAAIAAVFAWTIALTPADRTYFLRIARLRA